MAAQVELSTRPWRGPAGYARNDDEKDVEGDRVAGRDRDGQ